MITPENIKLSMRIKHDKLNPDIERNINICLLDLERAGVNVHLDSALLDKACELYCKWQYDYMSQGERYEKQYQELRDAMSLCGKYREGVSDEG